MVPAWASKHEKSMWVPMPLARCIMIAAIVATEATFPH
jgi:hypothetical protein